MKPYKKTTRKPGPFKFYYSYESNVNGQHESGDGYIKAFTSLIALDLAKTAIGQRLNIDPKQIGLTDSVEIIAFKKVDY